MPFDKIFESDLISKRERVERTINFQPVDRVPIHEQLSYNPNVIELYTGKKINGFDYTVDDIAKVVNSTLDATFPMFAPYGLGKEVKNDGFEYKLDNWTKWIVKKPFNDEHGAKDWLVNQTKQLIQKIKDFNQKQERQSYHNYLISQQELIGDTVLIDWSIMTGFAEVFDKMGLEIFTFFYYEYPEVMVDYMNASAEYSVKKIRAVGDNSISPVVLIAEDFCTKQGPIFPPETLEKIHYPFIKDLTQAWHEKGMKVIYHTDGNFKKVIPKLLDCGVEGFYCLERNCDMHIEKLKKEWPKLIWAGGVDGVDTMEAGSPDDVRKEVHKIIKETNAINEGGIFIDTSSEINPPIPAKNYKAMIDAVNDIRNDNFEY